ncbi:MAG TPA: serine/threonine-protein kinase [Phycisphaerales bacterium]|nr:serine/threonine-protein kinase [Phycisphaerales bacterium]
MSHDPRRAEALFLELADGGPKTRAALLEERCADDPALRSEVEALLKFHDGAGEFLNDPVPLSDGLNTFAPQHDAGETLGPGTRVGEYTIERLLGEGGMGVVYVARQERPSRTVALKVIRRGYTTPSLLRRFEHEAEMLGRLQHPGIANIFEAGSAPLTGEGVEPGRGGNLAYIAMEFIDGLPLHQHAREHALDTRARLALLARVCEAVHHAHQRGVIHRDLKPANILVDRAGQPKVLDFGVARAADADLRVTTMQTGIGQLIGTLPYMSPEQVLADPREVDTRSDVYALGVILYQLLTGRLPLDLASRSIPEAARIIRDESPARLSAVSRVFRGDIETIVAKAMDKDKARRYQSAAELAEDLNRYLAGEPIAAKQDSALYVLRKQIGRHRVAAASAGALLILVVAFAVYASWQAHRDRARAEREMGLRAEAQVAQSTAEAAQRTAERHREAAAASAEELAHQLSLSTIDRGRLLAMLGNTLGAEELIWGEYIKHPESRAAYWALVEVYSAAPIRRTIRNVSHLVKPLYFPDGQTVALAHARGVVAFYTPDLATRVAELKVADGVISATAVSPDGALLAAATQEGGLSIVRVQDGEHLARWSYPEARVQSLKFTADGRSIVSGDLAGTVRLHDVSAPGSAGRTLLFPSQPGAIRDIAVSRSGLIAASCFHKLVQVWNPDGTPLHSLTIEDRPNGLAFTPDGAFLLAATPGALIRIDTATWETQPFPQGTATHANRLSLSADGTKLLVVGAQLELWDGAAMKPTTSFNRSEQVMLHGALAPSGDSMIVIEPTGLARLWETRRRSGEQVWTAAESGWITGAEFSPDGQSIITVCQGARPSIGLWALPNGVRADRFDPALTNLRAAAFSPDGSRLATIASSGRVTIYDAAALTPTTSPSPTQLAAFDGPDRAPVLCFDARAEYLFAEGMGGAVLYNLAAGTTRRLTSSGGNYGAAAALPSTSGAREIVAVGGPQALAVWDLNTGTVVRSAAAESFTTDVAVARDGDTIAHPGSGRDIILRRTDTLAVTATISGHRERVLTVAFSPDGTLLASGGLDGDVHLWEVSTGRQLATLRRGRTQVSRVRFSPDGTYLLCTGQDGQVRLLNLQHYRQHIEGNRDAWRQELEQQATQGSR